MKRSAHLMFGIGMSVLAGFTLPLEKTVLVVLGGLVGSTAPDMDLRFRHRVFLHNITSLIVISITIYVILTLFGAPPDLLKPVLAGFIIGYISHILGDLITYRGVALFYPFSKRMFRTPLGSSDSLVVNLIGYMLGFIMIILFIYMKLS
ncbi:MAG: metal-dependent hydrolase [Sulfolobales archaeon]